MPGPDVTALNEGRSLNSGDTNSISACADET